MTLTQQEEAELQWLLQGLGHTHILAAQSTEHRQDVLRADMVHDLEHQTVAVDQSAAVLWSSSPSSSPPDISYDQAVSKLLRRKQQNREA